MIPAGVLIASAIEFGVECVTRIGSTVKGPASKRVRGAIVRRSSGAVEFRIGKTPPRERERDVACRKLER